MLKTISRLMLLALLIGGLVTSVATAKKDHEHKVLINHKGVIMSVPESALDGHLRHGDEEIGNGDGCDSCDPV